MLNELSNEMADARGCGRAVCRAGDRTPASGERSRLCRRVRGDDDGYLGREDGLHVRRHDGTVLDAELAGWDPATSLAVLRVAGLDTPALAPATTAARVGHLALAIGRSWSNVVTASAGTVSVIGGPLATGPRRWHRGGWGRAGRSGGGVIDEIIRTMPRCTMDSRRRVSIDTSGGLIGIATAAAIRGLGVIIPASIAWKTAAGVLEHGRLKRGYLGIAGQPVTLSESQQAALGRADALLVVSVTSGSPAAAAGILVGDVLLALDQQPIESPEDLLNLLVSDRSDVPRRCTCCAAAPRSTWR